MTRRMTLIVLALVGSMVLVVTIAPPRSGTQRSGGPAATAPRTAPPTLTDPDAPDISATLSTDPTAKPQTVEAELGDRVKIVVEGTGLDSVALGDLGVKGVEADSPATFELLADTPGSYPLVLTNDERQIGTLEIR